jgi:hypothetical protein
MVAIPELAKRVNCSVEEIFAIALRTEGRSIGVATLLTASGPSLNKTTTPNDVRFHDDVSTYTGEPLPSLPTPHYVRQECTLTATTLPSLRAARASLSRICWIALRQTIAASNSPLRRPPPKQALDRSPRGLSSPPLPRPLLTAPGLSLPAKPTKLGGSTTDSLSRTATRAPIERGSLSRPPVPRMSSGQDLPSLPSSGDLPPPLLSGGTPTQKVTSQCTTSARSSTGDRQPAHRSLLALRDLSWLVS